MNIKTFLSKNERELKVVAYGTVMLIAGVYLGRKYEGNKCDISLITAGDTGTTFSKIVGDKKYILSVIKEQI